MSDKQKETITKEDLSEAILAYLKKNGMTFTAFAEKVGIARPTLYRWLSGKNKIKRTTIRILEFEGVLNGNKGRGNKR